MYIHALRLQKLYRCTVVIIMHTWCLYMNLGHLRGHYADDYKRTKSLQLQLTSCVFPLRLLLIELPCIEGAEPLLLGQSGPLLELLELLFTKLGTGT